LVIGHFSMNRLIAYLRRYRDSRKHVRPWALAVPVLVLLVCLPLLRPLRYPDPRDVADTELARLATVQAMVERQALSLDFVTFKPERGLIVKEGQYYSGQPPVFAALLASAYWGMHKLGMTFERNPAMVSYLLTVLGSTLPAAGIAGLIYRMGRLFELPRVWRTALAAVVVIGSGLLAYATVLNEHVPAAALVTSAAACLVHIALARRRLSAAVWLTLAGLCAGLAATVDLTAVVFVPIFAIVALTLPWPAVTRFGGLVMFVIGLLPPLMLHYVLVAPVTGDWLPGAMHPELDAHLVPDLPPTVTGDDWDDDLTDSGYGAFVERNVLRLLQSLAGEHGLLSHFPVLVLGGVGISLIMHRHWPGSTKALAGGTAVAAVVIIVAYAILRPRWAAPAFATPAFVVFVPLLTFWIGAWLRRAHRPLAWSAAGVLLAVSATITTIGALAGPMPREPFVGYTAADALDRLILGPRFVDPDHAVAGAATR
jgi:hypothetical protein